MTRGSQNKSGLKIVAVGFVVLGLATMGYGLWSSSIGDEIIAAQQQELAEETTLVGVPDAAPSIQTEGSQTSGIQTVSTLNGKKLKEGEVFAKIYVPRFGKNYVHLIAEGVGLNTVLNKIGIGHYPVTQMPGEVGNFAIAGHRAGNGGPMRYIDKLRAGDRVYLKTSDTWYTYEYLQTKIVKPSDINVIAPVPWGLKYPTEEGKYLTLQSCTPIHVNTMRIVAWFAQIDERPAAAGKPVDLVLPSK